MQIRGRVLRRWTHSLSMAELEAKRGDLLTYVLGWRTPAETSSGPARGSGWWRGGGEGQSGRVPRDQGRPHDDGHFFSQDALAYVEKVPMHVVLVDGPMLARLMIEHNVGVTASTIAVKRVDSDYFGMISPPQRSTLSRLTPNDWVGRRRGPAPNRADEFPAPGSGVSAGRSQTGGALAGYAEA